MDVDNFAALDEFWRGGTAFVNIGGERGSQPGGVQRIKNRKIKNT